MKVFISWSGTRSRKTAKLLYEWLPQVINELEPWMSDVDIAAGGDWNDAIKQNLNTAKFGIICVTPGNQNRPWLLFESGALSRQMRDSTSRVAPLLIGFREKSELLYPLARFQATEPTRDDMLKLLLSLNAECKKPRDPGPLGDALDVFWPMFERDYLAIRDSGKSQPHERRSERDLLQEILAVVRSLEKRTAEQDDDEVLAANVPRMMQARRHWVKSAAGSGKTANAAMHAIRIAGTLATLHSSLQRLNFGIVTQEIDPTGEAAVLIRLRDLADGDDLESRTSSVESLLLMGGFDVRVEVIDPPGEDEEEA